MKLSPDWHRLSLVDPAALTGTCSRCGPGVRVAPVKKAGAVVGHACQLSKLLAVARIHARNRGYEPPDVEPEEVARLLRENPACPVCLRELPLHIDHCHETGRFRGLVCDSCNRGLGLLGESAETLERAARYLRGEPL